MGTLTIRLPEEKHERLRRLAEARKISVNKLMDELSTIALEEFDLKTCFHARAHGPSSGRRAHHFFELTSLRI